ncbi:MAG: endonuclease/exonuclease/phosphatase family protein [Candidatus Kapabacteria bacterium]|nr:endonuclease/exonuclease/phosphatase family protein [Candidatus Kapabacteria bacterium]MDW8012134.1 endonuclease/exonuclease/phosphatase family protein [Bacteroidota bacterium]
MRGCRLGLLLLVYFSIGSCQFQQQSAQRDAQSFITIGTFNIEWLGDGINDRKPRTEEDLRRLGELIRRSGVDLLGVQEVENDRALRRLLRYLPDFEGIVGSLGGQQNLGLLYRRSVQVRSLGEYTPLMVQPGRTRPGLLAYCRAGNADFYLMVVHLKSTSRYDDTPELQVLSRQLRLRQAQRLSQWVDSLLARSRERDIVIVGDFNDTPRRRKYPTLTPLLENPALVFLTAELRSCRYERAYVIDHVVVSSSFRQRFRSGSAHVVNFYAQYPFSEAERLSDHCPVVAQFDVTQPDND